MLSSRTFHSFVDGEAQPGVARSWKAWHVPVAAERYSVSADQPIKLPALLAELSGRCAAVCTAGHVLSWDTDAVAATLYCLKCGAPVIVACPDCRHPLPADGEMLQWVPYYGNCMFCGNAYPWKAGDIARAKRALSERAEVDRWSDAVRARAGELVDDVAAERAVGSAIVAGIEWLSQHGAQSAEATILDAVDRLGSAELKRALRPTFPGLF